MMFVVVVVGLPGLGLLRLFSLCLCPPPPFILTLGHLGYMGTNPRCEESATSSVVVVILLFAQRARCDFSGVATFCGAKATKN